MPYLGSGVDQHVNTAPVPTWVFTPTPLVTASVRLYNEGTQLVYVGGANVSPFNGLPISPGCKPVELQNITGTVYTCSAVAAGALVGTLNTAYTAGTTAFTLKAAPGTSLAAGSTFLLAGSTGTIYNEVLVVSSTTSGNTLITTTASLYDHGTIATLYAATTTPGQLRVTAGVV
jgi:hypothetical protein